MRGDYFNSLLDTADGKFHNREMLMRLLKASPNGEVVSMGGWSEGRQNRTVLRSGGGGRGAFLCISTNRYIHTPGKLCSEMSQEFAVEAVFVRTASPFPSDSTPLERWR